VRPSPKPMRFPRTYCEYCLVSAASAIQKARHEEAIDLLQKAQQAFESMTSDPGDDVPASQQESDEMLGLIQRFAGDVFMRVGQVSEAAKHFEAAVILLERAKYEGLASVLINLGVAYRALGRPGDAMAQYEKAIPLLEAQGNDTELALALQNAGNLCQQIQRYEEALSWFTRATARFRAHGLMEKQGEVESNAAAVKLQMGSIDAAMSSWNHARELFQRAGAARKVAQADINLANAARQQGDVNRAGVYILDAMEICRSLSPPEPELSYARSLLNEMSRDSRNTRPF
jgi:tetratricopeptide (TPR) repeat protein